MSIGDPHEARWFDLHIEPLRDVTGEIVGLTCAAVDITERKEGEAHLRNLMRELTHRSKNLLAVIQAMARQTARYAGSIDLFIDQLETDELDSLAGAILYPARPADPGATTDIEATIDAEGIMVVWYEDADWRSCEVG